MNIFMGKGVKETRQKSFGFFDRQRSNVSFKKRASGLIKINSANASAHFCGYPSPLTFHKSRFHVVLFMIVGRAPKKGDKTAKEKQAGADLRERKLVSDRLAC